MTLQYQDIAAGPLQDTMNHAMAQMREQRIVARILDRDHTVWKQQPDEIANRLGWLDSPAVMAEEVQEIDTFVGQVRSAGFTHALLLGMGGSSLAPEVFRQVFGVADGFLNVRVLDSTDPAAISKSFGASDPASTLYVPATKSGGTVETLSLLKYAYRQAIDALGPTAGDHFVAITDPGSGLAELATRLDFRHIFLNDPDIGGRYSALSMFGLVPAALCGIDIRALLQSARQAVDELTSLDVDAPSVLLGTLLGCGALHGRDKLTLSASPTLEPMGVWIEQLIAESTGKQGHGIVPIEGEPLVPATSYGADRLFVASQLASEAVDEVHLQTLADSGHPMARIDVRSKAELGAELLRWEVATVIAGHLLQINPFDQPDVESAKIQARSMVSSYHEQGSLPPTPVAFTDKGISVSTDLDPTVFSATTIRAVFQYVLESASDTEAADSSSYLALQAYLPPSTSTNDALLQLRQGLLRINGQATTAGYGPRFLHSTGQLHKGDAGKGLFVQITCDDTMDLGIPDEAETDSSAMSFGVLKQAQAMGDAEALIQGGRRVIRLHLGAGIEAGLQTLCSSIDSFSK
ncbi:MAG: glucose-6-phosphate isomerase [Gemmatimonadetes bacterium]|nr:glucose-6-phosphate isomerase [Gemmatimonadota bacterium]